MHADLEAHLSAEDPPPEPDTLITEPGLWALYEAWQSLGRPCALLQGLAGGFLDQRPQLYFARLSWLDEQSYYDPDDRAAIVSLWSRLDEEFIRLELESAKEASEEAKGKS